MNHSINPEKLRLLDEIRALYRRNNYTPRGKPLEKYSVGELAKHLENLKAGKAPWIVKPEEFPRSAG
jgi:hypothetical protein